MNKLQFAEEISSESDLTTREALAIIDVVFSALIKSLVTGKADKVSITGVGVFRGVNRAEKTARNPQTGERIVMPAFRTVAFSPGQVFKDMMAGRIPLPVGRSAASKSPKTRKPKTDKAVSE